MFREGSPLATLRTELRAKEPDVPIYEVGTLAAWPPEHRHGLSLLEAVREGVRVDGYVVGYPREKGLRKH